MVKIHHKVFILFFILAFIVSIPEMGANANSVDVQSTEFFPSTGIIDNFNRANGSLGNNWSGMTTGYAIVANKLDVGTTEDIYWNSSLFGVNQEVFITLDNIDSNASEVGIILKAQDKNQIGHGIIDVSYFPTGHYVKVWTYIKTPGSWQQHGTDIPVTFVNGDQFGARANANGDVEVYRNGELLGIRNVSDWPFYSSGGYIGLVNYDSSGMVLDDFGGGTTSNSPTLTPTPATSCTDPLTCNPVVSVPARWRCNVPECTGYDWIGSVIAWPSWAAYEDNIRTGSNSRTIYTPEGVKLYPYMGSWADGCRVTAVSGIVLIIEWERGTDIWRETYLGPGQSHTIDLIYPEDGVLLESPNDASIFSVSLTNCTPQNIHASPTPASATITPSVTFTPTFTPTNTATFTPSATNTATFTPTNTPVPPTPTYTSTNTATFTPSATNTATFTPTNTATFTPTATNTVTVTPTALQYVIPTTTPGTSGVTLVSSVVASSSQTTTYGATSGLHPSLGLLQQTGLEDDPNAYVSSHTPSTVYMGYQSFYIPDDIQTTLITNALLQVNFKGPDTSTQTWIWSIYDWNSNLWIKLGDNIGTTAYQWNDLTFTIRNISRYISPNREVRIQLRSNNANGDIKLDYEALHLTYRTATVNATPTTPSIPGTRPGISSVR